MRRIGAVLLVTMLLLLHPIPAAALDPPPPTSATCHHTWTDTVSPGVTTTAHRSTFTSNGERWPLVCQGLVRGYEVTGPGTFGESGVLDGSCSAGTGMVDFSFTLPTRDGAERFHMTFHFTFGLGVGESSNELFPGLFVFTPRTGDCVRTPVTEVDIVRAGLLLGG